MERSVVRDFMVGLFVLAGIGALVYLSVNVGQFQWHGTRGLHLSVDFNESADLAERSPVKIAGVLVGRITSIKLTPDFRAHVEMDLDPALKLPVDSTASIVTAGLLGDRYIELEPGGDEKFFKSGDSFAFHEDAFVLEHLLGQLIYGVTKSNASPSVPSQPAGKTGGR